MTKNSWPCWPSVINVSPARKSTSSACRESASSSLSEHAENSGTWPRSCCRSRLPNMSDPLHRLATSVACLSLPSAGGRCRPWCIRLSGCRPISTRFGAPSYGPRMTDDLPLARRAHRALEPIHTLVYFVPEGAERYEARGVTGGMRGYFASRSAPLGVVPAEVVVATFYNFSPTHVAKAIPSVWDVTTPQQMLEARLEVADAALTRLLGADIESDEVAEAAALARDAAESADVVGRPLFAAHAALPWPEPPHLQLWHAATLLREHRGDGHIAALVLAGLSGLDASITYVATGKGMNEDLQRQTRGYSEDEWGAAKQRLVDDGLLAGAGGLTDEGQSLRADIESQTDAAAAAPYEHLGPDKTQRLIDLAGPRAKSITKQVFG